MTTGWTPLALSVGLCAAVAVLEGLLTGSGLKDWYPRLRKPRWQIPLWASILVGLIVYVIDGFVAYRMLTAVPSVGDRAVALTALVVVMALNALWNYAFFEYRSTLVGFLGLIGYPGAAPRATDGAVRLRSGRGVGAHGLHAVRAGVRRPAVLPTLAPQPLTPAVGRASLTRPLEGP